VEYLETFKLTDLREG